MKTLCLLIVLACVVMATQAKSLRDAVDEVRRNRHTQALNTKLFRPSFSSGGIALYSGLGLHGLNLISY